MRNSSDTPSSTAHLARDGIVLIDKPQGVSSAQFVGRIKRHFQLSSRHYRIGHAGTLDPNATGLLVILLGKATRLAPHAEAGSKVYEIEIQLGKSTHTDDVWGDVLTVSDMYPTADQVRDTLLRFVGIQPQVPPQVSAVRVQGQRAYHRVRNGEVLDLAPRQIEISAITDLSISGNSVRATVSCSKGTYMRALARDLGQKLGCGACLSAIRRIASAPFHVKDAVTLEALQPTHILSWSTLFPSIDLLQLEDPLATLLLQGNTKALSVLKAQGAQSTLAMYGGSSDPRPLGLLRKQNGKWEIAVNVG